MPTKTVSYKGKDITIEQRSDRHAHVTVEGKTFHCDNHGDQFGMWSCPSAFYMPTTLESLAKHLVDYWYILTDPGTPPPPEGGHGPGHGTGHAAGQEHECEECAEHEDGDGHAHHDQPHAATSKEG